MHNNIAINKHRRAIVPETGLMRETLVRLCRKNLKIVVSRTDEGFANVGVLDARAEFSRQTEHSLEPD